MAASTHHPLNGSQRSRLRRFVICCTVCCFGTLAAAEEIPLHIVEGNLLVRVRLRTAVAEVPAHVVVDLGTRAPFLLHYATAALLGLERPGPVDLLVLGSRGVLLELEAVPQPLEPLESFSAEHGPELEEIPAVGVLGLPAFGSAAVTLDVDRRILRWERSASSVATENEVPAGANAKTIPYTTEAYGYWLQATGPTGQPLRVRLATAEYDTRIDVEVARRLGAPDGDVSRLMLGDINIAEYAVLRPSDLSVFPEPHPDVVLGTHFFSHFRVRIDPRAHLLTLVRTRAPQIAQEERQFFKARERADVATLEEFLTAHPDSRLAADAAEVLLIHLLDQPKPDRAAVRRALDWQAKTAKPNRRAATMVRVADELIDLEEERADAYDLALLALEAGEPFAADDLDATAIHQINARRGLVALLREEYTQAHRYLLSAAFGTPKDPYVNLWLGRYYEKTGQLPRAWSRYLESALHEDAPRGARRGLDRLNNDPAFRRRLSMRDAGRLMEGRVPAFMPVERFDPTGDDAPTVHLVELFTSVDEPYSQAAELAFDGLGAYLQLSSTAFIEYHLGSSLTTEVAKTRAAFYGSPRAPAAFFDGQGPVTESGEADAAPRVFAAYRARCARAASAAQLSSLAGDATRLGDELALSVSVEIVPGGSKLMLHAVLCEEAVMALGANGQVLHHYVARATFSPGDGWPIRERGGAQPFAGKLDLARLREIAEADAAQVGPNEDGSVAMHPTWIDGVACQVVVFVQDPKTRHVVSSMVLPLEQKAPEQP